MAMPTSADIHSACENGDLELVQRALEAGRVDIDAVSENHETPLSLACLNQHVDIARLLLEEGCHVNKLQSLALFNAIMVANLDLVRMLILHGSNLNAYYDGSVLPRVGDTALIVALDVADIVPDIYRLLVEQGADVTAANVQEGNSPLHFCTAPKLAQESLAAIRLLIEAGADINAGNKNGSIPLHHAIYNGNTDAVRLMVDRYGADVLRTNKDGHSSLHTAALLGYHDIARFLVEHDASVNMVTKTGTTALLIASVLGHTAIVRYLLGKAANVNKRSKHGDTALHSAAECLRICCARFTDNVLSYDYFTICKLLLEAGTHLDIPSSSGRRDMLDVLNHAPPHPYILELRSLTRERCGGGLFPLYCKAAQVVAACYDQSRFEELSVPITVRAFVQLHTRKGAWPVLSSASLHDTIRHDSLRNLLFPAIRSLEMFDIAMFLCIVSAAWVTLTTLFKYLGYI